MTRKSVGVNVRRIFKIGEAFGDKSLKDDKRRFSSGGQAAWCNDLGVVGSCEVARAEKLLPVLQCRLGIVHQLRQGVSVAPYLIF